MKKRDKGKWMIAIGVLLIVAGIGIHMQSRDGRQERKEDTGTTQAQQEEQASVQTEPSEEDATEQGMEQSDKQDNSNKGESKDKIKEIPTDKWPYGNEEYVDYDEPMRVREFHNNKEYYDAVVEQFAPYEGKDISFYTDKVLPLEFDENPNKEDGTVKVTSYDVDTFKALMKYTRVDAIDATGDFVDFYFETTDDEAIYYFYDENISEENSEYINHYFMVNIAPHWWWVRFGAGT